MQGTEDLVNDIFTKMLQQKVAFETLRNVDHYLQRLTKTKCRDFKQRHKTRVIKMEEVQEYYQDLEDQAKRQAEIRSTAQAIHYLALELLPPHCKEVFILSYIRDMRNREIAERLGISEKTVENHINLALNRIRKEHKKDGSRMYYIKYLLPVLWEQISSL